MLQTSLQDYSNFYVAIPAWRINSFGLGDDSFSASILSAINFKCQHFQSNNLSVNNNSKITVQLFNQSFEK